MNLQVESLVEQSVNRQVDKLVGERDGNLSTILKMTLLPENYDENVLAKIRKNNELEKYYIEKEYLLTYDSAGNIIDVDNIDDGKGTKGDKQSSRTATSFKEPATDTGSVVSKPE
jgi:hypothetical protein